MYKKKAVCAAVIAASCYALLLVSPAFSDTPLTDAPLRDARLTDAQIRRLIVENSIRGYPGNCPCPDNVDRAGRRCGARSAWNRRGGYTPICFTTEVSDEQVREYRSRLGV